MLKSKKRKPKRCNNKPSTYTNSDPESISCISRPFLQERHAILMTKQEQLESKIKEVKSGIKFGAILPASEKVQETEN
jgi:hypothetical protein